MRLLVSAWVVADLLMTVATGRPFPGAVVGAKNAAEVEKLVLEVADSPTSSFSAMEATVGLASPPGDLRHQNRHRRLDKSIAGAEVILGALAAIVIVAVISYIRVTRKRIEDYKVWFIIIIFFLSIENVQ